MAGFSTETPMATAAEQVESDTPMVTAVEQAELASATQWVEEFKAKNANARWDWGNDEEKSPWKVASHWQAFHRKWTTSREIIQPDTILDAGIPSKERALQTKDKKFYVRQSYVETFGRVWRAAASKFAGILVAGQPGIGKTIFLWYLLVRLLQDKQVVLLHIQKNRPLLFLHDEVYELSQPASDLIDLPTPSIGSAIIWSLFDLEAANKSPPLVLGPHCFFVQAPSPHPERIKWTKKYLVIIRTALPLWTRDELRDAIPLSCDQIKEALQHALERWPNEPLDMHTGVMDCLRRAYPEERPPSVEAMLDTILDRAIDIVGPIARDVYGAMFSLTRAELQLEDAIGNMSASRSLSADVSNRIVCVYPEGFLGDGEVSRWDVTFRSRWVQKTVVERLVEKHREQMRLSNSPAESPYPIENLRTIASYLTPRDFLMW
ncbi:hypothetical protein C8Q74DRAFT_380376 [Fomes fomentarius]|nr:hypothetical protein C8Q74DRAFT_380376 [Fomes fomentarius]